MKMQANLPDINQLFNNGLKDTFPFNVIRVCVLDRITGNVLYIYKDVGKPIRFKDFNFDIIKHDLGIYIPSFYAKRNWVENVCSDSIITMGANDVSYNDYAPMPIFIRPDGSVRKYVVIGLTRGVLYNGQLRSIPGFEPVSNRTIEEFRALVRNGRDINKWGIVNQDMIDCIQLLFKFAFQVTKSKTTLGIGWNKGYKQITGSTLVAGCNSGYVDPFQFGKDKPDARIRSLLCVVDGRLQFSNWDGKFYPIKIANNKTLDECIVEETDDYIIYSDGDKTEENPIPEGIYFACRVDKHTGEIYYGEGYRATLTFKPLFRSYNTPNGEYLEFTDYDDYTQSVRRILDGGGYIYDTVTRNIPVDGKPYSLSIYCNNTVSISSSSVVGDRTLIDQDMLDGGLNFKTTVIKNGYTENTIQCNIISEPVLVRGMIYEGIEFRPYVRTKCPHGKITLLNPYNSNDSTILLDTFELDYISINQIEVSRDENLPATSYTSNRDLKITPYRPDLNQEFIDMFSDINLYPFNLMGRYVLHKTTGEIIERLNTNDSTLNFYGGPSVFDPNIHDIFVLLFPFYARRYWDNGVKKCSMLFEIPKEPSRNGYEVPPAFLDVDGSVMPYIAYGAFKGCVKDGMLRSIPNELPIVNLNINQARTYARTNRDRCYDIESIHDISVVQFLYEIAFQDTNSQKVIGNGWTNKTDKTVTGATMLMGNRSGGHLNPFVYGDVPDRRLRASLVYVNGRLEYYTNPKNPIALQIANNKTLDECIVEETDDYIIYSDGDKTEENPIPEGIYFACRVDKHTGEIYYGEGYENANLSINPYGMQIKKVSETDEYEVYTVYGTMTVYGGVCMLTAARKENNREYFHDFAEVKARVLYKNRPTTSYQMGTTNTNTVSSDVNIKYKHYDESYKKATILVKWSPTEAQTVRQFTIVGISSLIEPGTVVAEGELVVEISKKSIYCKDDIVTEKPYVKTKCPTGKISWGDQPNVTHLNHSFIIKNSIIHNRVDINAVTGVLSSQPATYFMDTNQGEVTTGSIPADIRSFKGSMLFSNSQKFYKINSTKTPIANSINFNRNVLSLTPVNSSVTFNRYKSMEGFYIYEGDLTEAEFNSELAKNIKPISIERAKSTSNGNQISLFGIEDYYGNVWSLVDGAVVKDNGIWYTMNNNDWGDSTKYNIHIPFTPPMGVDAGGEQNGYIKNLQNINGFINYPKEVTGNSNFCYPDYHISHRRGQLNIQLHGTAWGGANESGVWNMNNRNTLTYSGGTVGCRLMVKPRRNTTNLFKEVK